MKIEAKKFKIVNGYTFRYLAAGSNIRRYLVLLNYKMFYLIVFDGKVIGSHLCDDGEIVKAFDSFREDIEDVNLFYTSVKVARQYYGEVYESFSHVTHFGWDDKDLRRFKLSEIFKGEV